MPLNQNSNPRAAIQNRKQELNGIGLLRFPKDLGAHSTLLIFKQYKYTSPGVRGLNRVTSSTLTREELGGNAVLLPLPREIKDSYTVKIAEFEQGMFGDAISQAGSYVGSDGTINADKILANVGLPSASAVVTTATGLMGSLASKFLGGKSGSVVGGGALGALIGGNTDIGKSIEAGAGAISNPKQALHFQGVELKRHNFSWTMAPTSQDESKTIMDITNLIRRNSLPSYTNFGQLKRAILNYPSTVDIYFFGIEQQYFMYYKTCMIDSLDFNYTSQGMTVLKGGKPAVVTMSMSLKEMDIHTAEDYTPGNPDALGGTIGVSAGAGPNRLYGTNN